MDVKQFKWSENEDPIVTLTDAYWADEDKVEWHGPSSKIFKDYGYDNVLTLHVLLKWIKPYGGIAKYKVIIEEQVGEDWRFQFIETIGYIPNSSSSFCEKKISFGMLKRGDLLRLLLKKDLIFKFRISVSIRGHGAYDSGSGGHEVTWSDFESKEFTAIFKPPETKVIMTEVLQRERELQEYFSNIKKRFK